MISLKTELCRFFGIEYPIIQAGMAGGPTTAELVSAVSEAGALGTLGAAYLAPDVMRNTISKIQAHTERPFAVNIFASHEKDDFSRLEEMQTVLAPFRSELQLKNVQSTYSSPDWSAEQFVICIEKRVPIISTAFGSLSKSQMEVAKTQGVKVIVMVTTVKEALLAEQSGADAVVAQGSEAGGHRSTFSLEQHPQGALVGTMSLVPQVADAVRIPVIAAGGIVDGRGLVSSLALGAQGVQLGTRFLTAEEAGTHAAHKKAIFDSDEESTVITKVFSGRPARGIKNRFIEEVEKEGIAPLPFPSQNTITKDIRAAAAENNNAEFMSLWAGQSTRMLTEEQKAADIVDSIMEQAQQMVR